MSDQERNPRSPYFSEVGQHALKLFSEGNDLREEERDGILNQMREVLAVTPEKMTLTVTVPSWRLVELGLVSEPVAGEIQGRIARKQQEAAGEDLPDEPKNLITIKREGARSFLIQKSFMTEEQFLNSAEKGIEDVRRDILVEEKITLSWDDQENPCYLLEAREVNDHLHALGVIWERKSSSDLTSQDWIAREATSRDILRTLIMVIEGISPGCLTVPQGN